ncbi:hypothetical protein MIMGU_mgv1a017285mg [Erythranthe guttata]|uniref:Uncharacterized protein n=1 Tax=Erythranthe guttata TaxID=4155 RepID=A0A022QTW1_ERYGU|nr:hypothetical protein MIMGU_mgv1a017285mg [Erythranthe guttata]
MYVFDEAQVLIAQPKKIIIYHFILLLLGIVEYQNNILGFQCSKANLHRKDIGDFTPPSMASPNSSIWSSTSLEEQFGDRFTRVD